MKRAKEIGPSRRISARISSIKTGLPELTRCILSVEPYRRNATEHPSARQGRVDRGLRLCRRHESRDRVTQTVPINRLRQMFRKPGRLARREIFVGAVTAQGDAAQPVILVQVAHQLEPRSIRKTDITDHEIK